VCSSDLSSNSYCPTAIALAITPIEFDGPHSASLSFDEHEEPTNSNVKAAPNNEIFNKEALILLPRSTM
jgi:hypothetical protein